MERLARQEACQLYIEEQIEEGLEKGWTPYQIGKEVAEWVQKLFEVKVQPKTIAKRAERQIATNVASDVTSQDNKEIEENQKSRLSMVGNEKARAAPLSSELRNPRTEHHSQAITNGTHLSNILKPPSVC